MIAKSSKWAAALIAVAQISISPALAQSAGTGAPTLPTADQVRHAPQIVPVGTPVRLMNLKEINSRSAIVGHRFKLRVHEPVYIEGKPVIPVGTTAWGEVASFDSSGAVGKGGKLGVRILYLDLPEGRLPLRGDANQKGNGNGAGVAMAIIGFGLFGLFTAGDSARLKGGDQLTAYVDTAIGVAPTPEPKSAPASAPAAPTPAVQ